MLNGIEEIEGLTPEQIEAINQKAEGILSKNNELLDKLSKTKQGQEASTSELEALRQFKENAEIKMAEDSQNWEESRRLIEEKYQRELESTKSEAEKNAEMVRKLVVDNSVTSELVKLQVNPDLLDMVAQQISTQAQVVDGKAMINDKSLSEYLQEWKDTPQGKAARLAAENSGIGSNGGSSNPAKIDLNKPYSQMTLAEQVEFNKRKMAGQ
jgi:hypothetical protein